MTTEENTQATSGIADTSAAHEPQIEQAQADVVGDSSMDLSEKTFADFGVSTPQCQALEDAGIIHPFPIQALTLPV
ncbi:MAG: ATP-dependent helicase, partial [Varibaculum cambriense]|nr:ATP-dependent helicase [Varibaculum cambriense]